MPVLKEHGGKILFVAIYLNLPLLFFNDECMKDELKTKLSSIFRMKDLRTAESCPEIRITRNEDDIALNQEAYVESHLYCSKMQDTKPA